MKFNIERLQSCFSFSEVSDYEKGLLKDSVGNYLNGDGNNKTLEKFLVDYGIITKDNNESENKDSSNIKEPSNYFVGFDNLKNKKGEKDFNYSILHSSLALHGVSGWNLPIIAEINKAAHQVSVFENENIAVLMNKELSRNIFKFDTFKKNYQGFKDVFDLGNGHIMQLCDQIDSDEILICNAKGRVLQENYVQINIKNIY